MEYRRFGNTFVIRIDKGEEIVKSLTTICEKEQIGLGWVKGIGAVNDVTIGLFETATKTYISKHLKGDYEITGLLGNISRMDRKPYLHLHINISGTDYNVLGGHLNSATVSATCEIILHTIEGKVGRQLDENIGINLYNFSL